MQNRDLQLSKEMGGVVRKHRGKVCVQVHICHISKFLCFYAIKGEHFPSFDGPLALIERRILFLFMCVSIPISSGTGECNYGPNILSHQRLIESHLG